MEIWIPYGESEVFAEIKEANLIGILEPLVKESVNVEESVEKISKEVLPSLVGSGDRVLFIVDHPWKPAIYRKVLGRMAKGLEESGVRKKDVTVLFGRGLFERASYADMIKAVGEDVIRDYEIIQHDPESSQMAEIGRTGKGVEVLVNKKVLEADVRVALTTAHFDGLSGYWTSKDLILPGISAKKSVIGDLSLYLEGKSAAGVREGNPVYEDRKEAMDMARIDLSVEWVLEGDKVVSFGGGRPEDVEAKSVRCVDEVYRREVKEEADICVVSAGGYPFDETFYHACESLERASLVTKEGGVIVALAQCREGYGPDDFFRWMEKFKSSKSVASALTKMPSVGGFMAYRLRKVLERNRVYVVSALPEYVARVLGVKVFRTFGDALDAAFRVMGRRARVLVIQHGTWILPRTGK